MAGPQNRARCGVERGQGPVVPKRGVDRVADGNQTLCELRMFKTPIVAAMPSRRPGGLPPVGDGHLPQQRSIESVASDKGPTFRPGRERGRRFIDNVEAMMNEIDVLLVTSKTEGLNTSVLNAFAQKVPVVSTNAGGLKEIVIHEKTGLSAEVKDSSMLMKQVLMSF